jgi:hypothetical protein
MAVVAFERRAEQKIREAMDAGEFDNLPNAGSTLDLEPYFAMPAHLRMAHSILKSANCLPAEIELLNEVARLETAATNAVGAEEEAGVAAELQQARLRLALALERLRTDASRRLPRTP